MARADARKAGRAAAVRTPQAAASDPGKGSFGTLVLVGVACCAFTGFATYRVLNDDYEIAFERNMRHMAKNMAVCVQTGRYLNTTGPIPSCVDPVDGHGATVDVADLPPAAPRPAASAKSAKSSPVAVSRERPSPLLSRQKSKPLTFRMPEREGPMPPFAPAIPSRAPAVSPGSQGTK